MTTNFHSASAKTEAFDFPMRNIENEIAPG